MQKIQYIILILSVGFFVFSLNSLGHEVKSDSPQSRSRDMIMQKRFEAIEHAEETGSSGYSFDSSVSPILT